MSRFILFVAFLSCWAALPAVAAPARSESRPLDLFDVAAPSFASFSPRDGVPSSVIVAVRTDRDGFVWVGSPSGVARYDGHRWTPSEDPDMAHPVDSLAVDRQGTLWAAFRDHGLAHYDGTRWHVENEGLPSRQIRRFAETRDADGGDAWWALTWDRGLMRRRDGHWVLDPGNAELPRGSVLSMAQTQEIGGNERLWVGTGDSGLWFREGDGPWQRFRAEGFDASQVEYLLATRHAGREELWISVFAQGVWRLTRDGVDSWTREHGDLPTDDVYDIAETPLPDGDRAIWIASRAGVIRIHDGRTQSFDRRHGLPSDGVRGLGAWRSPNGEDVLWLATESGVARTIVGANRWQTASLMGMHGTGVFAVLVEPDGRGSERLWVGASEDGLGLFENGRWQRFDKADGALPDSNVRMIKALPDESGQRALWIGTQMGYLLRVHDGPAFEIEDTPWPKRNGESVQDMMTRTIDGRVEQWVGLRLGGAYRKRDGKWTSSRPAGVGDPWRVYRILEQRDASGRSWLWASTNLGLARFDGVAWTLFGRERGLEDTDLIDASLIPDRAGRPILWLGSGNAGIIRVDVTDPERPTVLPNDLPAPPDLNAYGALADSKGRIYICTNNGVQQLTPAASGYVSHVFTRRDGMIHDECNTDAQWIDGHDRYWAGTLGGLAVYDPEAAPEDTLPKALRIVDMRIDGKPVAGDRLEADPSAREIDVTFALLSWQRESESRFRTQLVGYETEPGAWSAQTTRSFTALAPGRYVLRIEGRDYAGNLSAPIELAIEIEARWWQETWVRVLIAAGLLLVGYGATILRLRALKAQRRSLERRVSERTAELNAANARLVELSYVDALTGLANRRRLLETLDRNSHDAATSTALIFVDVDYFKEYNDRFGHPAGDEALRAVAAAIRQCAPKTALVARYGGEEFACLCPEADTDKGVAIAECIRGRVAAARIAIPGLGETMRVTISAGVASTFIAESADAHRLLRDADIALYQAKREGRNRVRTHEDAEPHRPAEPTAGAGPCRPRGRNVRH